MGATRLIRGFAAAVGFTALISMASMAQAEVCGEIGQSQPTAIPVKYVSGVSNKQIYSGSYALVVGASAYTQWTPLDTVSDETKDVANALARQGFRVRMVCNPKAQGDGGLPEVERFLAQYGHGDNRLVIFLSGHGWVDGDEGGVYAAVDSPQPRPPNLQVARQHGLGAARVIALMQQVTARHVLVVMDSCYSASIFVSKGADPLGADDRMPPTLQDFETIALPTREFISVGTGGEEAPSPSIFAPAFVLGVSGYADLNHDGIVRASELAIWIRQKVSASNGVRTTPRAGLIPHKLGVISGDTGEIVFRYSPQEKQEAWGALHSEGKRYLANLDVAPVGTANPAWPDPRYRVSYYRKPVDGGKVIAALEASGTPYLTTKAVLEPTTATNGLACVADTPIAAVKQAASALIRGGTPLRIISRATIQTQQRRFLIQALHFKRVTGPAYRDLTLADIDTLTACPSVDGFYKTVRAGER